MLKGNFKFGLIAGKGRDRRIIWDRKLLRKATTEQVKRSIE
jgi:hypothetical protein